MSETPQPPPLIRPYCVRRFGCSFARHIGTEAVELHALGGVPGDGVLVRIFGLHVRQDVAEGIRCIPGHSRAEIEHAARESNLLISRYLCESAVFLGTGVCNHCSCFQLLMDLELGLGLGLGLWLLSLIHI